MILMIDPPVNTFSTVDAVRDWIVELAAMRERYRDDSEALRCVVMAERDAIGLLESIQTVPPLPTWEQLLEGWATEAATMDAGALDALARRIRNRYRGRDITAVEAAITTRRRELAS